MRMTKAKLQEEIERLKSEKDALQKQVKDLSWEVEDEKKRWTELVTQDNALLNLLDEVLRIKVAGTIKGENRAIVWTFSDTGTGQALHQNESLPDGFRSVWDMRRMRREDEGRCGDCGMRECICTD